MVSDTLSTQSWKSALKDHKTGGETRCELTKRQTDGIRVEDKADKRKAGLREVVIWPTARDVAQLTVCKPE